MKAVACYTVELQQDKEAALSRVRLFAFPHRDTRISHRKGIPEVDVLMET
jgi:hypothetical protein